MFDKRLLALVPDARKHIIASVGFQWIGILATIALFVLVRSFLQNLLVSRAAFDGAAFVAACAAAAIVVRMACVAGAQKQGLAATAAAKQTVRQNVYDKLVALGPAYREQVATSEAVQISVEGAEQLERYSGSYLPPLFYAVLAPTTLFVCLAPASLPAAASLLMCVPLIPASIMGV